MKKFFVRTNTAEPEIEILEKEDIEDIKGLFDNLPIDKTIINRFPFDDSQRASVEIYRIGSEEKCQEYIDEINVRIKHYFKIEEFSEEDYSNPLIFEI